MKTRFEVLDIFRGLFSVMVVLSHMQMFTNSPIIKNGFVSHSDLFVDFFFVLSGFVIGYNYQSISDSAQLKNFCIKRFFRLYPLHLIMLLLFVGIESTKSFLSNFIKVNNPDWIGNNINSFFTSLFLLNSVKLPGIHEVSWNMPSWSISAEMISYVLFGIILMLLSRIKGLKYKEYVYAGALILSMLVVFIVTGSLKLVHTYDYGFLRGLIGFFTGLLCLSVYNRFGEKIGKLRRAFFSISEVLLIVAIICLVSNGKYFLHLGFLYEILFFASILIFSFERGIISDSLKKVQLLHNLGKFSYSIYMTHILILSLFNIFFIRILKFSPESYSYLFLLNIILIYKISEWTYQNIEKRFTKVNQKAC